MSDALHAAQSAAAYRRPVEETAATKALHLLDARRIRRDALKRNFDLDPDDLSTETAAAAASHSESSILGGTRSSPKRSSSPSKSSSSPSTHQQDDFALFGRVIPQGVFRDRVRHYLMQTFPTLILPIPPSKDEVAAAEKAAAASAGSGGDSPSKSGAMNRLRQVAHGAVASSGGGGVAGGGSAAATREIYGHAGAKRIFRRAEHNKTADELRTHRKLLDAARGELSADVSAMLTGGNSFRKLVRSTTDAEEKERQLLEARAKLPFSVTEQSMYTVTAFADRPPSPRTLRLQARRARVAHLLSVTADYSSFISLSTPSVLFWMLKYMLKQANLAPANTFFGMPSSPSDGTKESEQQQQQQQQRSCAVIINPHHLATNLKIHLPWSVLDDQDVDWLMRAMAPSYQEAVDKNREAAHRGAAPSLLITLAKTRRAAGNSLDPDLDRLLAKHEAESRTVPVPADPISLEAALLRLNRALQDASDETGSMRVPLALLCYAALMPRAMRSSKALLNASASVPPPALTNELLAATSSEYEALGDEKMASWCRNYAHGFHVHFTHIAVGHDPSLLFTTAQAAHASGVSMHVQQVSSKAFYPTPFPPGLSDLTGEEDCPVCSSSGLSTSYSYIDASVLAPIREEARGSMIEIFEEQVLRSLSSCGEPKLSHEAQRAQQEQQQKEERRQQQQRRRGSDDDDDDDGDSGKDGDGDESLSAPRDSARVSGRKEEKLLELQRHRALISTPWQCDVDALGDDLGDFITMHDKKKTAASRRKSSVGAAKAAAAAFQQQQLQVNFTQLNNRYFDCFVTHLVLSPQFCSLMASMMLKQIVEMAR